MVLPPNRPSKQSQVIEHLGVRVDSARRAALVDGCRLDLTPTEYRLLELFLEEPGRTRTRDELMQAAIAEQSIVLKRTIDVHICSLRRKLGIPGFIETVRGIGYRVCEHGALKR